ncbi:MAG: radical SAM/SPASM domain-containing protein [Candidatus Poribacteria bacterium]
MHFQRIHIELTNNCNFSCAFCPDSLMTRARGNIDFSLLCKVLDEVSREKLTDLVLFHVMGEPALYPELYRAVEYAKNKGLKVHLTTNGSILTEELFDGLLGANIDHILFSVQTPDEKSFELRNSQIKFDEYKKHISFLIAKALTRKANTKITLSFLTTPFKKILLPTQAFTIVDNNKSLVKHVDSWLSAILAELLDEKARNSMESNMRRFRDQLLGLNMLVWNKLKITDSLFLETRVLGDWVHRGLIARNIHRAFIGCCEGLTKHFGILWNGDIVFCCVDFDGNTKFGNIKQNTIKEVFAQENIQDYIRAFKGLRIKHPYCQACLGDSSFLSALARQVGSIVYFKYLREHWNKKWAKE